MMSYNYTYLFVPLMAFRVESYYKFNQTHALGFHTDLNLDIEWDAFGDLIGSNGAVIARLMLAYRITIPNR